MIEKSRKNYVGFLIPESMKIQLKKICAVNGSSISSFIKITLNDKINEHKASN